MKKIYMILAAISLLSMSLNAQLLETAPQGSYNLQNVKGQSKAAKAKLAFEKALYSINGMSSILPETDRTGSSNGQLRAPYRYNTDLYYTVGPFEGDNFDNGIGFPNVYDAPQAITMMTRLERSEYESHIGDNIIGFRFALYGDQSKKVKVDEFYAWPNNTLGFGTDYSWHLADLVGNTEPGGGDDPGQTTYQYVKITDAADLTSGQYLIVCEAQNVAFNGSLAASGLSATNNQASVTITNSTIESNATTDGMAFTYDATATSLQSASGYYIGRTTGSSGGSLVTSDSPIAHSIIFSNGVVSIRCNGAETYYLKYNSSSNCFRYYLSGQTAVQLYKKVAVTRGKGVMKANRRANRDTQSIVVADGTTYQAQLPVYGLYQDYGYRTQMIYTEDMLDGIEVGDQITSLTFYPRSGINFAASSIALKMGPSPNNNTANFGTSTSSSVSRLDDSNLTLVATVTGITTNTSATTWTITFDNPYTYTGGNLLVDIYCVGYNHDSTTGGACSSTNFYGANQTNCQGLYITGASNQTPSTTKTGSTTKFMPKTTFTYENNAAPDPAGDFVELTPGQWHEFYLDEPVEFQPSNDDNYLYMGYDYVQYPSSNTTQILYPVAMNSESTGHNHYAYMTTGSASANTSGDIVITVPSYNTMFYQIVVFDGETFQPITQWDATGSTSTVTSGGTNYTVYDMPTGWTLSNVYMFPYTVTVGEGDDAQEIPLGYLSSSSQASITIANSALNGATNVGVYILAAALTDNQSIDGNGDTWSMTGGAFGDNEWDNIFGTPVTDWYTINTGDNGDLAVQLIFESTVERTDPPVITADTTATVVTITATATDPNAAVTLTIDGQTYTGTGSVSHDVPRGNTDTSVNVSATAQEDGLAVSIPATETIGIPALPVTPTPVITYNETTTEMVVTATGQGTVTLVVNGQTYTGEGTVSATIPRGTEDQTYTATATAQLPNYQVSETASETFVVHEAGRSPMPTITFTDNGDGTYTVTVTGTGEVAVYINDAEHGGTSGDPVATGQGSVSFTVEQHSQAMTLPLQATNQEEGLAVSHTAEATYNIPAMTIDNTFSTLDPQPANASTPIDLSKLMFCDRFSVEIPNKNNHPWLYDYYLQETQVRQRTSNSVEVPVKHTGSDGLGFYSLNQIDNDLQRELVMDVRNAAMELPLEADPGVFYYTESRGTKSYPDQADRKWLAVLQRTSDGTYSETLNPSYDYEAVYPGGQHHVHLDLDTITGDYNSYLTYVPIVWTMGFDRVNYETDHTHNSYGAPKWKTGVADVIVNAVDAERQINSASTTWNDNGKTSMYMLTVDATGIMPTVNTMPYEPYMFRVFVESANGKLRGWQYVEEDSANHVGSHYAADEGSTTGPICVWSEYVKNSPYVTINGDYVYFVKNKVEERDSLGNWVVPRDMNIMFAALDDLDTEGEGDNQHVIEGDLKIYVRFYYIVEGSAEGHVPHPGVTMRDGDDPSGYGSESPGTPPSPSTGVKEMTYYGDVVSTTYYNVQGMSSSTPFNGINIVVVRYSNGATRTIKVVR